MLKNMKNALQSLDIPLIGLTLYIGKALTTTPSLADGLIMAIIAGLCGYNMLLKKNEADVDVLVLKQETDILKREMADVKAELAKRSLSGIATPQRRF